MRPTRRDFLWTIGALTGGAGLKWGSDVVWADQDLDEDPGWTPGVEAHLNSTCLVCPARCGIRTRVVDGNLVRIGGNPLHPVNRGGMCPRGIAGVQMLYHPDRITTPLRRIGARGAGEWSPITVEEALEEITNRLRTLRDEQRPEGAALLAGHASGTMHDLWTQFFRAFGSPNVISDDYDDGMEAVIQLMHGISRAPSYDLERASFVLSFGAPLFESWWSPLQASVAFANPDEERVRGTRFVQVDTRFSRTAARTQEWVGIRPGTHAVLALGLAYVIIRDELYDASFVDGSVAGFGDANGRREGYRSIVMREFRTEEVSATTGVPVERITTLARALAEADAPVVVCGTDVTHAPNGLLAATAVHSLNILLNRVNRPGGVLLRSDPPVAPLSDARIDAVARDGNARGPVVQATAPYGTGDQALAFAAAVADDDAEPIDTLFLYYANPLASSMRPQLWTRALGRIPFVVSFSPFLDETTRYADLVLPDLLPYERWQDAPAPASYPYPVWGVARPVVTPPPAAMNTGDVILGAASRLGGTVAASLPYADMPEVLRERARGLFDARRGMLLGDAFERAHHQAMEARGWWLPEHEDFDGFWGELVERGGWVDLFYDDTDPARLVGSRSGRIELMPQELVERVGSLEASIVPTEQEHPPEEFPLRLIPYRLSTLSSGTVGLERWLAEQPALFPEGHWVPWVEVSPHDADVMGIGNGTMVWVTSPDGRYQARLTVSHGTAPETVCAPYGMRHPDGRVANPFALLNGEADSLTGLPAWSTTFVRLERV